MYIWISGISRTPVIDVIQNQFEELIHFLEILIQSTLSNSLVSHIFRLRVVIILNIMFVMNVNYCNQCVDDISDNKYYDNY